MSEVEVAEHLGGHLYKTHIDGGTLRYLKRQYNIQSMVDVGCSVGGMVRLALDLGMVAHGIDGDESLIPYWRQNDVENHISVWDFTKGPYISETFDLGWCVEFLEHVDEQYIDNYFEVFKKCKYVVCTAAEPGDTGGHHHVNLRSRNYWIDVFKERGFRFDPETTNILPQISTMTKPFMQRTGMFYHNESLSHSS